jgi:predicted Zn finger-like uncharacterized protein
MILTCPSCGTQYVVKDGAIPPGGRQVRCASCKHSWHQDPEDAAEPEPEPQPIEEAVAEEPAAAVANDDESLAEATLIEPRSGPEAEERAYEEAALEGEEPAAAEQPAIETEDAPEVSDGEAVVAAAPESDWSEPPLAEAQSDEVTPYPTPDEAAPRRRGPLLAIVIAVLVVVAIAAAFWFLAPAELRTRLGLAEVGTSPLALVTTHMDRQRLESGNELLTVTGRVINPTRQEQPVPPLRAQLKSRTGKIVYSWTIAPPARSLPAGASASFNSAEVNVPPGGDELTITLGAPAG